MLLDKCMMVYGQVYMVPLELTNIIHINIFWKHVLIIPLIGNKMLFIFKSNIFLKSTE